MNCLYVKQNVEFTKIAPGGFRILSALDQATARLGLDLVLTSACDGVHSGPGDPHPEGKAYDIRSHDLAPADKDRVLATVMYLLGWDHFYGFLENPGKDTEHFHFQVKKGTEYPPPFLNTTSGDGPK